MEPFIVIIFFSIVIILFIYAFYKNRTTKYPENEKTQEYQSESKKEVLKTENTVSNAKIPLDTSVHFFLNLFSRLSFVKNIGIHGQIDFLLFSIFKARLCAVSYVEESDLSDDIKTTIIEKYDFYMYLAFYTWMEENAKSFVDKEEIFSTRMMAYNDVFLKCNDNPFVMSFLSSTLYWFIENGWVKNYDHSFSVIPQKSDNISELIKTNKQIENTYAPIYDDVETITLSYCAREIAPLIKHLKNEEY